MIKTLVRQIKEYKSASIVTPIFMILEVAMEMVIPLLMASIIDDGVQAGDMKHIFAIGCYMILAAIVGLFAGVMGGKYGAKASTGFARNLREAMYENIQTFSFSNIPLIRLLQHLHCLFQRNPILLRSADHNHSGSIFTRRFHLFLKSARTPGIFRQ